MIETNKELIDKYIFCSDWMQPYNQACELLHAQIYFKAESPDGKKYDFESVSIMIIKNNEIPDDLKLLEKMRKIKQESAILILKDYIWESLSKDCLIHPKMIPYSEDGYGITEEEAKKHNDYWAAMAKEILPDGNFLVLVKNIKIFNPKTKEFENFGIGG